MRAHPCAVVSVLVSIGALGCEAAKAPTAPTTITDSQNAATATTAAPVTVIAASTKPDVPASGIVAVPIAHGSLDISTRYDAALNIGSNDPTQFSWKGQLVEGWSPFDRLDVGIPGRTVPADANWVGLSLSGTTVKWGKTTYTRVGALDATTGGVFHVVGSVTLPLYRGQRSDKAVGTFTASPPTEYSFFTAWDGTQLELRPQGGGKVTMSLEWVPIPLEGDGTPDHPDLPDGYWQVARVSYRFE
jgi:hypothetical protein